MSLQKFIEDKIREDGPIGIDEYMSLALSHPEYGYYMGKDPLGAGGDFITSPEISQIFGEVIGAWIAVQWQQMGRPQAVLMEPGPGRGTLMHDLLRATRHLQGFHDALDIVLVETSPALKQKQWKTLAGKHPRITWQEQVKPLPRRPLLLIANEFFDALPIKQFADSVERKITLSDNGSLAFTLPADSIRETCRPALDITQKLAAHMKTHGGAGLIVDYGYEGGSRGDTLQAVKAHQYHDILIDPGSADLTAHVDFDALAAAARKAGAVAHGPVAQGAFLGRLGAVARAVRLCEGNSPETQKSVMSGLERLVSPDHMGERFKVLAVTGPGHPKPEGF